MALVLRQPNLDNPDATNLFFDSGDGRIATLFVTDDRQSDASPLRHQIGSVQRIRVQDGAEYAETEHLEQALDELGIDSDPVELPDAPTGADVDF